MELESCSDKTVLQERIKQALNEPSQLIIEICPEFDVKLSLFSFIFENLPQNSLIKLIICTVHSKSIPNLLSSLNSQNIPATSLVPLNKTSSKAPHLLKNLDNSSENPKNDEKPLINEDPSPLPDLAINNKTLISESKVLVCSQDYIFRKGYEDLSNSIENSVLIFEDSMHLDTCYAEFCSISINLRILSSSLRGIEQILQKISETHEKEKKMLEFYENCKKSDIKAYVFSDLSINNAVISENLLNSSIPGSIRKPSHFLKLIKIVIVNLRQYLRTKEPNVQSCFGFLHKLLVSSLVNIDSLKFSSLMFNCLCSVLSVPLDSDIVSLRSICDFCSFVSLYPESFALIYEPYPESPNSLSPVLQLACNDCSGFFSHFWSRLHSCFFFTTSCTPLPMYSKLLGLQCKAISFTPANGICPLMLTKGSDQLFVTTKVEEKTDDGIMRNYGELLLELSDIIPDGIVGFFPEWQVLENYIIKWNESGVIYRLLESKVLFIESHENGSFILEKFRKACQCGRGAILLAVYRGKVAENLSFFGKFIKCSIAFGVPQPNILSRVVKARLLYLKDKFGIEDSEYLNFDAVRQAVFCVTHGIRATSTKSLMILADKRYDSEPKKSKIPAWMKFAIKNNTSVSTDVAKNASLKFLRTTNIKLP